MNELLSWVEWFIKSQLAILFLFTIASFVQNMAFTAVSRSRASGDIWHHWKCAIFSNGIWFGVQALIVSNIWEPIMNGDWLFVTFAGLIYTCSTSLGSVYMMHLMLKTEKGLKRVGAYPDQASRKDPSRS